MWMSEVATTGEVADSATEEDFVAVDMAVDMLAMTGSMLGKLAQPMPVNANHLLVFIKSVVKNSI